METDIKQLQNYAKELRKNMTPQERHLWYDFLKQLPVSFRRQQVIGNYIADFYCPQFMLVIELDGSQHYFEHATQYDSNRNQYMESLGYKVLRYSNREINENFKGVCEDVLSNPNLM